METLKVTPQIFSQNCKDKTNQKTLELTKLLSSNKKHNAKFQKDFHLRKTCKSCLRLC